MDTRPVLFPVTCTFCERDQLVMVRAGPEPENLFESIKCVWCDGWFEALVPDVVIGGPYLLEEYSHF
jgi:hypothetical protein